MSERLFTQTTTDGACPKCGLVHQDGHVDCPAKPATGGGRTDKLLGTTLAEHFEIISLLGEGGMSVVYKARDILIDRIVAIKLLREHLVGRDVNLARFQQEAKAASHLSHPNIITIFEFGVTSDDQPYLVMDYLEGISLGEMIQKEKQVPVDRALHIFSQICDALGFAHQKKVIHRDLKPSNVMLTTEGEDADRVKIVDFGIAKMLPGGEFEGQRLTQTGEVFGSPVYMSPEQCTGQTLDARSDIYAMGCVMYETLCGRPPFVGGNPLETMYLRLADPPAPFDPELRVPKALEHIVLITLAKEPDQRYQTMGELKAELDKLKDGAGRSTGLLESLKRSVRLKQVRQTKKALPMEAILGVVALMMMVAGFFSIRLLSEPGAADSVASSASWKQHYNEGQKALDRGELPQAETEMSQAVKQAEKFGELDRRFVTSLEKLSSIYKSEDKKEEAEEIDQRVATIKQEQALGESGESDANVTELADLTLSLAPKVIEKDKWAQYQKLTEKLNHLAMLLIKQQDYDKAEELLKKALEIEKTTLGDNNPNVARTVSCLAALYDTKKGRFDDALPLYEQAVAIRSKALGSEHPEVAGSLSDLAALYAEQGKYQKAEELYKHALGIYEKSFGKLHPYVAMNLTGMADLYRIQGKYKEAEPLYEQALEIYLRTQGPEHRTVAMSLNNLAGLYFNEGKYGQAEQMYSRALNLYEKVQGPEHPNVAMILNNLAVVLYKEGKYKQAEPMLKRALAVRERTLAPDHPEIAQSLNSLAEVYRAEGRYEEAEPLYKRALSIDEKALGPDHPEVALVLNSLGQLYKAQGKNERAEENYTHALKIRQTAFGPEHPEVAASLNELAELFMREGKYKQSEELFQKALAIREKALGPNHPDVAQTLNDYSDLLVKTNRSSDALKLRSRTFGIWLKSFWPSA